MLKLLMTLAIVLAPFPAFAQQTTTPAHDAHCLLSGRSFSPGTTVRASDKVQICGADGNWAATTVAAAGCLYADRFYSVGAVFGTGDQKSVCGSDGTWSAPAKG